MTDPHGLTDDQRAALNRAATDLAARFWLTEDDARRIIIRTINAYRNPAHALTDPQPPNPSTTSTNPTC